MDPLAAGVGIGLILGLGGLAYGLFQRGEAKDWKGQAQVFELRFQNESTEHARSLKIAKDNAEKFVADIDKKKETIDDLTKRIEEVETRAITNASPDDLLAMANSVYKNKDSGKESVRRSPGSGG